MGRKGLSSEKSLGQLKKKMTENFQNWETFSSLAFEEKQAFFSKGERLFDILSARQFSRAFLDENFILTNKIRLIAKTREGKKWLAHLLANNKVMLFFSQPSTRTFLSFATASATLGLSYFDVRNASTSSEVKGETFEDTIRTFSSYFDLVIMRHHEKNYAEKAAWVLNNSRRSIPLINAGSSSEEHPTQALLDIFTLRKSFNNIGGLEGKTIMMAGDLRRGRTIHSLSILLSLFSDVKVIFSSPKQFAINENVKKILNACRFNYEETRDFSKRLPEADAVYMTRVQDEYNNNAERIDLQKDEYAKYTLGTNLLSKLKASAIVMHPLPRRHEIEKGVDNDPRAMYWRQMRNGMWVRCALIAKIFKVDKTILEY